MGRRLIGRERTSRATTEEFWALRDVSFEVKRGEVVGIIGRNGAGKSTLLKILSRITEPTCGRIEIDGRVASLLEVGTGFHAELTGRENIYLNGSILGMTRAEIKRKFDEIVAFAEVEKFLDTPVKRYSSGMYMRLAFAVAAHLEPEILIVDEVLAVGDFEFQKKCLGKIGEVAKGGRTVLFVSHNIGAVQSLCNSILHLNAGTVVEQGPVETIIPAYLSKMYEPSPCLDVRRPIFDYLLLENLAATPAAVPSGGATSITVSFRGVKSGSIHGLCILLFSSTNTRVAIIDLRDPSGPYRIAQEEVLTLQVDIRCLNLVEGEYKFGLYVQSSHSHLDLGDLASIRVLSQAGHGLILPYPAVYRGFVELDCSVPCRTNLV
ncbi:MAG TPA: ABC transporter ATP-binding protein [Gemmataceae bacterium]|nr:ABC transporter ATP-binding protein [Gemmataceae bacterium]